MRRLAYPYGRFLLKGNKVTDMGPKLRDYTQELGFSIVKYDNKNESVGTLIIGVNKKIGELIKYMAVFERRGPSYANKELGNYFRKIYSLFSSDTQLDGEEFQERLTNVIVALKLFIVHMPSLMKNARKYVMVFTSLNHAYFQAFGKKNQYTTPLQELISLSEVACVLSEMNPQDSTIKKLFQIIT